jgi:DNA-binding MarR family transcriptional regulator
MNKAVELLVNWDRFNQDYPDASLNDFCKYFLARTSEKPDESHQAGLLLKTLGRITSAFGLYHRAAMATINMPSPESFFFLNGIAHFGEVKKTNLIRYLFFEYTTGMEAINKLIRNDLVTEKQDPDDRRAKLLTLTEKGKKLLDEGYRQSSRVSEILFSGVDPDTINLSIRLLQPVEEKHSRIAIDLKNEDFEEIYRKICQ